MTRSRGWTQDKIVQPRGRFRVRARHPGSEEIVGGSLAGGRLETSDSVAVGGDVVALVDVAISALVAKRGDNRRNPDLAVTIVEALVLALGVLALLRRSCRIQYGNSPIRR